MYGVSAPEQYIAYEKPAMFHDYLQTHRSEARQALIRLFKILDIKPKDRDPYDDEEDFQTAAIAYAKNNPS